MYLKVFIQARMSSNRLPKKVLMDFNGTSIIRNVVDSAGLDNAVVLTSIERSDDPLVDYLKTEGIEHFRGSLNDVFGRFCDAINYYNIDWVMRICADSPLIPPLLLQSMAEIDRSNADIVTNVFPRSFPKGHSVEIIRAKTMLEVAQDQLSDSDKEHVTSYFYRNIDKFKIISVTQPKDMSHIDMAVDTREDYDRLLHMSKDHIKYSPDSWRVKQC